MNKFVCKRLRLCNYLMDRGFFPYQVEPDKNNTRYNVYIFENTPAVDCKIRLDT